MKYLRWVILHYILDSVFAFPQECFLVGCSACACNLEALEDEAGESQIQGQSGQLSETLSENRF